MSHFSARELSALRRLRARFLEGDATAGDYWREEEDLALYDSTFAERIGWKWEAVLGELEARGWRPSGRHLVDWGCGTGVATRRVLAQWPSHFQSATLHDRSSLAMRYAAATVSGIDVQNSLTPESVRQDCTFLVSHVLNELPEPALSELLALAQRAGEVIWVEAGTHAESRRLDAAVREPLRAAGFTAIAPCTHSAACGMLAPENARHWCHSFARPPSEVFQSARWAEFSREMGVDLRSLPYSFLVLQKAAAHPPDGARVIGHPREYKGFLKLLNCDAAGVGELTLAKRSSPNLWRTVRAGDGAPLYRWEREGEKIVGGEPLLTGPEPLED